MNAQWTVTDVRRLGVRTDVATAGSVLGIGRTTAYQLVKAGQFPVTVITVGGRLIVPVAGLLATLGIEQQDGGAA